MLGSQRPVKLRCCDRIYSFGEAAVRNWRQEGVRPQRPAAKGSKTPMQRRSDDQQKLKQLDSLPQRGERIYEEGDGWYFKTREGISVGPYRDMFDAELSASLLISRLAQLEAHEDPRAAILHFQDDPAVGPIVRCMSQVSRSELDTLLQNCRRERRLPTFRKAWRAVSRYLPHHDEAAGDEQKSQQG
jgi:hypothetical protein